MRDPLLRVDDEGWVPWLSPDQAATPVPVAIECKPAPLIPEMGHIPEHKLEKKLKKSKKHGKQRARDSSDSDSDSD